MLELHFEKAACESWSSSSFFLLIVGTGSTSAAAN